MDRHRQNWAREFILHGDRNELSWGDPSRHDDPLGDYAFIRDWIYCASYNAVVVDIGTFTGKWLRYMDRSHAVFCVDIIPNCFKTLSLRFPNLDLRFYQTPGDDLNGIEDNSADVVFSMDALMRAPEEAIENYLKESLRVLKVGGRLFLHLPCTISPKRIEGFTGLDRVWILSKLNGWSKTYIDYETVKHGIIVRATK